METSESAPIASRLLIGRLRVDLSRDVVTCVDEHTGLSPRAEDLLLLLCRHPGALVTREQILQRVWQGAVVEDGAITNCVWQIRKSLGDDGRRWLKTRSGRGYMLSVPQDAWRRDGEAWGDEASGWNAASAAAAASDAPERTADPDDADRAPRPRSARADPREKGPRAGRAAIFAVDLLLVASVLGLMLMAFVPPLPQAIRTQAAIGRIPLAPEFLLRVSVVVTDDLDALRTGTLRVAAQAAFERHAGLSVFNRGFYREPFEGASLHVELRPVRGSRDIEGSIELVRGRQMRSRTYRGSASEFPQTLAGWLRTQLPPPERYRTAAADVYLSGVVSELRFDSAAALAAYRKAAALDPAMPEARIAVARADFAQGRWREAIVGVEPLTRDRTLPQPLRCELSMMLLDVAPKHLRDRALAEKQQACAP
jgi:DNA-binding winged helix-turn-helix (wHTH) protein